MLTHAEAATLFAAGVLLDVIAALYYLAVAKERVLFATVISFVMTEFSYLSYFYVLSGSKLDENMAKLHWYAAGCAVGTFVGLAIGLWRRRKEPSKASEPPLEGSLITGPDRGLDSRANGQTNRDLPSGTCPRLALPCEAVLPD